MCAISRLSAAILELPHCPNMTTLLRRSGNLAKLSRSASRTNICLHYACTRSSVENASHLKALQTRLYATIKPKHQNPENEAESGSKLDAGSIARDKKKGGRAAKGFEQLYTNGGPMSGPSPGRQNGGSNAPKYSPLTMAEEKALNDLLALFKKGLSENQSKRIEFAFQFLKRDGLPPELREIMKNVKETGTLSLAAATRVMRLTYKIGQRAVEEDIANIKAGNVVKPTAEGVKKHTVAAEQGKKQKQEHKKEQEQQQSYENFQWGDIKIDTGTVIATLFVGYLLYRMVIPSENLKEITWQEFRTTFLDKGLVNKLTVVNSSRVRVELHREATAQVYPESPAQFNNFYYYFTVGSVEAFERKLDDAQKDLGIPSSERIPVAYTTQISWLGSIVTSVGPTLFLIGALYWMSRRAGGGSGAQSGIFGIGKSRAKRFNHESEIQTKFKDVAGMDEAKAEIMEFVSFLKSPGQYQRLGAKIPRGAILSGPPGTGKTLLAKATAGESQVPFFSVSGSEFVEMFVGVGPSRVRDLFANARKNTPCIIFIDEIDAIGKARGKGHISGGNDERESTLNQILTEMDGFNTSEQVVVLAGTNRLDVLDKALLRPGRFDRHIAIDRPTMEGRKQIFLVHLRKIVTSENMDHLTGRLAALTPGFSGADIANCVNEAALIGAFSPFISLTWLI